MFPDATPLVFLYTVKKKKKAEYCYLSPAPPFPLNFLPLGSCEPDLYAFLVFTDVHVNKSKGSFPFYAWQFSSISVVHPPGSPVLGSHD